MKYWKTKNGYEIRQLLSGRSNVFLVSNGTDCILVDTSIKSQWAALDKNIQRYCPPGGKLKALILTHGHFDHTSNAARVLEKYSPTVIAHRREALFLSKGEYPLPKGTVLFTKLLMRILKGFSEKNSEPKGKIQPILCNVQVEDRFDLNEMGFDCYLLHTPGHTAGCISLIVDHELALVGDAMFGVFRNSIFPPFADEEEEMIRSWKQLIDTDCSYFLPSHGTPDSRELLIAEYEKYRKRKGVVS